MNASMTISHSITRSFKWLLCVALVFAWSSRVLALVGTGSALAVDDNVTVNVGASSVTVCAVDNDTRGSTNPFLAATAPLQISTISSLSGFDGPAGPSTNSTFVNSSTCVTNVSAGQYNAIRFNLMLNQSGTFKFHYTVTGQSAGAFDYSSCGISQAPGTETDSCGEITVTVKPVNVAPTFTIGSDQTVAEDAGAQTVASFISNASPGPANESGQTLTYLVSNANSALFSVQPAISPSGQLTYTPAANANGTATVSVRLKDNGGVANGGVDTSAAQTFTITVSPVNDAPVVTVPAAQSVAEAAQLPIGGISVADPDADAGSSPYLTVSLAVSHGTLDVTGSGSASVSGSGTATVSVSGTVADVNGSIGSVQYTGVGNYNGGDTLTVTANDNGNTGSGVALTDSKTVAITVDAVNNSPVVTVPGAQTINEDIQAGIGGISVSDVDAGSAPNFSVTLSVSNGTIDVAGSGSATVSGNDSATVSVTGSVADVAGSLASTKYTGNANYNGADSLVVKADDNGNTGSGGALTDTKTVAITVAAVNDAPVVTVPAALSGDEGTQISISGIGVSDVDADAGTAPYLSVTLSAVHGTIDVAASGSASVNNNDSASVTVSGSVADVSGTLASTKYTGDGTYNGNDTLTVAANDNGNTGPGSALTDSKTILITVAAVNNPPVVTVPGAQTTNEDIQLAIGGISVADPDADAGTAPYLSVTLSVSNGTIDVAGSGSALVSGNDSTTVTVTGSVADVSGALASTNYTGNANYHGPDTLTVKASDNGNTGIGGAKTDLKTVGITVVSVNDPPVYNNTFSDVNVNEDAPPITVDLGSAFTDPDVGDSLTYTVTIVDTPGAYVQSSIMDLSGVTGATTTDDSPTQGASTTVFTTTATSLSLPFLANTYGEVNVSVEASDQGRPPNAPAAPVPLSASGSFTITVAQRANDMPHAVDDSYTTDSSLIMPEDSGPIIFDPTNNDYLGNGPVHIVSVGKSYTDSFGTVHAWRSGTRMADPNNSGDMQIVANGQVSCLNCQATQTADTSLDGSSLTPTTLVYQPEPNFNGIDSFTYCIKDSDTTGEPPLAPPSDPRCATVTVKVTPVDNAPVPRSPIQYTMTQASDLVVPADQGLRTKVVDIDNSGIDGIGCDPTTDPSCPAGSPHPDTLYFRFDSATTAHGQLLPPFPGDGSFQYRPDATYSGDDSFQFDVCDTNDFSQAGHCAYNVTVNIVIQPLQGASTGSTGEAVQFDFQLANIPLELPIGPDPNVLIINDDSGSMNWDILTSDSDGVYFLSNGREVDYVLTASASAGGAAGYNGRAAASEESDPGEGLWRLRDPDYNSVYYNHQVRYDPWKGLAANGQPFPNSPPDDARNNPLSPSPTTDLLAPENYTGAGLSGSTETCQWVCKWGAGHYPNCWYGQTYSCSHSSGSTSISVSNYYIPRYYTWTDKNGNGEVDATPSPNTDPTSSEGALVEIKPAADGGSDTYPKGPDRTDCVTLPNACTYQEEIQNFANWFTYSRNREFTAKSALGQVVAAAQNMRVGYVKLNSTSNIEPIKELNSSARTGAKAALLSAIYATTSYNGTPLRRALNKAGRLYECASSNSFSSHSSSPGDANCPVLAAPEGNCQQNFTLLMTDGTWNGSSPYIGNADDDHSSNFDGGMFAGSSSNTLGDVAMYYYERDLQPSLPNEVPTTGRDRSNAATDAFADGGNTYMHQHMTTYTVSLGGKGNITDSEVPTDYTQSFDWGNPNTTSGKIDDLRHAAVNGRGAYYDAAKSGALADSLIAAFHEFAAGSGAGAAVSFNSQEIQQNTLVFRAFYNTRTNTGDLVAVPLTAAGLGTTPLWSSATQMDLKTWDQRQIMTLDPATGTGIPFRPDSLTGAQRNIFISNPGETTAQKETEVTNKVDYLRGDSSLERPNGVFRERPTVKGKLGDIVHSKPVYVGAPNFIGRDGTSYPQSHLYSVYASVHATRKKVIYAAANDGMLHAFNADTGDELFAYVPNNLMLDPFSQNITNLLDYNYTHKFFVDLTPAINDVYIDANGTGSKSWQTVLVGGQGAGGKAYYALNVTDPSKFTEAHASDVVMWEFTQADDTYPTDASGHPLTNPDGTQRQDLETIPQPVKDLGYTFSVPTIAMSNLKDVSGNHEWIVLFGNGDNSTAGIAKLFVLFMDRSNKTVWCHPDMIYDHVLTGGTAPAACVNADGSIKQDFVKINTHFGAENGYPNGLGTPRGIDVDGNGTVDYVYAGDLFGNFYRFDLTSSDFHDWSVTKIFKATYTDSGGVVHDQPITTQPIVTTNPTQPDGYIVIFATGSYITLPDGTDPSIQSIYGLWDRLSPQEITKSELVHQHYTNLSDTTYGHVRTLSNNPVDYASAGASAKGWYDDLDAVAAGGTQGVDPAEFPGEKAIRNLQIRGGLAFVNSVIPRNSTSCIKLAGGFALSFCPATGGLDCLGGRQIFDLNNDGNIDSQDQVASQVVAATRFEGAVPTDSAFIGSMRVTQLSNEDINLTQTNTSFGDNTGRLSWKQLKSVQ